MVILGGFNTNVTHYDFAKPKLSTITILILYVLLIKLKKWKTKHPRKQKIVCRQKETPTSHYPQDIH